MQGVTPGTFSRKHASSIESCASMAVVLAPDKSQQETANAGTDVAQQQGHSLRDKHSK